MQRTLARVRMASQRREGPVDLFGEQGSGEFVREGQRGKREKQVRPGAPFGGESVVTAEEEDEVAGIEFGLADEFREAGGIDEFAGGVEEDFAGGGMAGEEVEARGSDFAHLAIHVAAGALEKLLGDGVGVGVAGASDEIEPEFHCLAIMPELRGAAGFGEDVRFFLAGTNSSHENPHSLSRPLL